MPHDVLVRLVQSGDVEALRAMIEDAGFERVEETARFKYGQRGMPPSIWHAVFRAGV